MKILILGYSKSGKAAYKLLNKDNQVTIVEDKKIAQENLISTNEFLIIEELFDLGIISPGFQNSKVVQKSERICKELISEFELGMRIIKSKHLFFVTGSNGKTTLCTFLNSILNIKYNTYLLGNIGVPLCEKVESVKRSDYCIFEISSFQLEKTRTFKNGVAIITNISPNHLDAYQNYEDYIDVKKRIFFAKGKHYFITKCECIKDENIESLKYFSCNNTQILFKNKPFLEHDQLKIKGYFNYLYLTYALEIGYLNKIKLVELKNKALTLNNIEHRLNLVRKINNVEFINDSKSTSIEASIGCLKTFSHYDKRIIILGGINKSRKLEKEELNENDLVLSFGKHKVEFGLHFATLKELFDHLKSIYKDYQVVLFTPGGSSYDLYSNYIERGVDFVNRVNKL